MSDHSDTRRAVTRDVGIELPFVGRLIEHVEYIRLRSGDIDTELVRRREVRADGVEASWRFAGGIVHDAEEGISLRFDDGARLVVEWVTELGTPTE
ncbi:MAG: hypothetical protein QOE29_2251 [Gaiellaceae bacterium]|nr:hypothetical protein [Gaiellaceae bacterium]